MLKVVVVAIDALEYDLVEEFNCKNLKQEYYGKTDITEFSEPRTMVLWSSFITGKNKEKEVLKDGKKEMWNKKYPIEETFFSRFKKVKVIDLPAFSYDLKVHERSRKLLKDFFDSSKEEKEKIREEYNKDAFEHHRKVKEEFFKALDEDYDFVLVYFSIADVIGHLNFGNKKLMKMIYKELDEIVGKVREKAEEVIVLSDHGMKAIGYFGDHSNYGFWSTNFKDLGKPRITDFFDLLKNIT